ncbi:MAG: tetratricopeptide repeat protein [Bacteroidia bacterium]
MKDYNEAIFIDPDFAQTYYNRGLAELLILLHRIVYP